MRLTNQPEIQVVEQLESEAAKPASGRLESTALVFDKPNQLAEVIRSTFFLPPLQGLGACTHEYPFAFTEPLAYLGIIAAVDRCGLSGVRHQTTRGSRQSHTDVGV
jgi:hypothetical protein